MAGTVTQSQLALTSDNSASFSNPPWWHRRSRLERILIVITTAFAIFCSAMTVTIFIVGIRSCSISNRREDFLPRPTDQQRKFFYDVSNQTSFQNTNNVCLTPGCVRAAAVILNNIDERVSPCDDFYQFACGGWLQNHPMPDDRSTISVFSELQDDLDLKLRVVIEEDIKENDPVYVKNMKNMYNACMNTTIIEKLGNEPLQISLAYLGGWPVIEGDKWNSSQFSWMETLFALRRIGFSHNIFLSLSIGPDIRNNTRHIIDLDQSSLGMPDRSYLLNGMNDSAVKAYYQLMVDSAVLLGADRKRAEQEMKDTLEFETMLANISVPREERRNISRLYNKVTVNELYDLAPKVNWTAYFNNLLTVKIPETEDIIVVAPDFVQNLESLLSSMPDKTIANYMLWRVIGQAFPMMGQAWGEISQHYSTILTGKTRPEARWQYCLGTLTGTLSTALASLYVRKHFKQDSKKQALQMVEYIQNEFLKILDNVEWMDNQTKEAAKQKAESMKTYIGYPNELLDHTKIADLYSGLILQPNKYYENILTLRKWATDYVFSKLRTLNIKGDWKKRSAAAVVNAFYNSIENSIEFPAGVLQGFFFNTDRPNYLNYGAIGFVIGHEITHGFDDRGRQFDKNGNNKNWWQEETDEKFREKAQCIINQYGNYTVPELEMKVNGINTQGENIADNGGIKEAFRAYQQWQQDHHTEPLLPGLPYSPNQLFWISAANIWCGKYRPETLKLRLLTGSHSPASFRVIGSFSNSPEFASEFKCPLGSPMNPEKKCEIW